MSNSIRALHWGKLPTEAGLSWRHAGGALYAFWPAPFPWDACFQQAGFDDFSDGDNGWDAEWDKIVELAVADLTRRFGQEQLHIVDGPRRGLLHSLARKLFGDAAAKKRSALSPALRLLRSTYDDQVPSSLADFGQQKALRLRTGDGHRVLWISAAPGAHFDAAEFADTLAEERDVQNTKLSWGELAG